MDKERKSKQGNASQVSSRAETESQAASRLDRKPASETSPGGIWIREDGAVCIGNECVTIKTGPSNETEFTIDPDRCACEVADQLLDVIAAGVISGKGITITMKPRTKQDDQESHK